MEQLFNYCTSNCFICDDNAGSDKRMFTCFTDYSEKPIFEILEIFTEQKMTEHVLSTAKLCSKCFWKFNDYDKYITEASKIQMELTSIYRRGNPASIVFIKSETDTETFSEFNGNPFEMFDDLDKVSMKIEESDHSCDKISVISCESPTPVKIRRSRKRLLVDEPDPSEQELYTEESQKEILRDDSPKRRKVARPRRVLIKEEPKLAKVKPKIQKCYKTSLEDEIKSGLSVIVIDGLRHYRCDICQKNYTCKSQLKIHRMTHGDERNFICDTCGASFKTVICLSSHRMMHRTTFFQCDLCSFQCRKKYEFRCHMDVNHLGRKDFICQICGRAFGREYWMQSHVRQTHVKERNVSCGICGFKTFNKTKLKRHMKSHTGERNFECEICGKRFLYKYNVTAHIKHVHNREKRPIPKPEKLICTVCGLRFQRYCKVKQHMNQVHNIFEDS